MNFPSKYSKISISNHIEGEYEIVPIRYEDRLLIMKWRNEQIYHLRQHEVLTEENQTKYFQTVVAKIFENEKPSQILFSYLKNSKCIGYGGLVHINWVDKNAEISFIMNTELEKNEFHLHWKTFLSLIEKVAFFDLKLHKIFTYAFDLRPHLYPALETSGFLKEAELNDHCFFNNEFKKVILHSKINYYISYRLFTESDKQFIFDLNNDNVSRSNSFHNNKITAEEHETWFTRRINDENSIIYICKQMNKPVGLVRFQKENNIATIGINVLEEIRGKGLAKIFLIDCCKLYFKSNEEDILAYIKPNNIASIKTFKKANFKFFKEELINDTLACVYKLVKNE